MHTRATIALTMLSLCSIASMNCADAETHAAANTADANNAALPANNETSPTEDPSEQAVNSEDGEPEQEPTDTSEEMPSALDREVPFQSGAQVETTHGNVEGKEEGGLRVFKGIPYAKPPVGERRFRRPESAAPWDETLDASDFGPSCMQSPFAFNETSEDCLSLNVWAHNDKAERPVMVWIYGGGFILGETAMGLYEGADLAVDADVVVITLNYRLGLFGNLALPELAEEDPEGAMGNMSLLDQIEALRWIKANAPAFGGDPDNITVFGESAGAISTCALMGAPAADDLFHKAIVQSGNCSLFGVPGEHAMMADPVAFSEDISEELGCDDPATRRECLRDLPAKDLSEAIEITKLFSLFESDVALGPVVDGVTLPEQPSKRLRQGRAPARPVIFGSNGNEGAMFASTAPIVTRGNMEDFVAEFLGSEDAARAIVEQYPRWKYPSGKDAFVVMFGELLFNCDTYNVARAMDGEAYVYHLMNGPAPFGTVYGPLHAADIPYVFGNFDKIGVIPTLLDLDLSARMQTAWGAFAHTGRPTWEGGWRPLDASDPEVLEIGLISNMKGDFRDGRCEVFEELGVLP